MPTRSSISIAAFAGVRARSCCWCSATASAIWSPIVFTGIQARHRLLEDHADLVAAHRADLGVRERQQVPALEFDCSAYDGARRRDEPHDRQARHRLAGARFADDGDRLAAPDVEADAVDGPHDAVLGAEMRLQVAHGQKAARPARLSVGILVRRQSTSWCYDPAIPRIVREKAAGHFHTGSQTIMLLIVR